MERLTEQQDLHMSWNIELSVGPGNLLIKNNTCDDEIWTFQYDPETKCQLMPWKTPQLQELAGQS